MISVTPPFNAWLLSSSVPLRRPALGWSPYRTREIGWVPGKNLSRDFWLWNQIDDSCAGLCTPGQINRTSSYKVEEQFVGSRSDTSKPKMTEVDADNKVTMTFTPWQGDLLRENVNVRLSGGNLIVTAKKSITSDTAKENASTKEGEAVDPGAPKSNEFRKVEWVVPVPHRLKVTDVRASVKGGDLIVEFQKNEDHEGIITVA